MRHAMLSLVLWLLAVTPLLASCASEPKPVDRVQQNLVEKEIFEGEWWYSSTSIDVTYDQASIFKSAGAYAPFDGSMSTDYGIDFNRSGTSVLGAPVYSFPIARIRFVIDEDYLFAFRSFELVAGGNDDGRSPDFRGQPLAVFKIEAHVDIRRDYNPVTGEEGNVRVENTADQRWFERRFMRVDWSQNLIQDFAANDAQSNELFTSFKREPTPFLIQEGDPAYPASYHPQFVRVEDDNDYRFLAEWPKAERDKVHYMSFVTKETWSPGGGCLTKGICASADVTMRNAFLRVPTEHEYAVATMTHREFDRFGIFRSHQPTYARGGQDREVVRQRCATDADCGVGGACDLDQEICVGGLTGDRGETDFLAFYMTRHNLYADSLSDDECVSNWECSGVEGSVCDASARRCTLPPAERTVRKLAYRLGPHFPPYLVRETFASMAQWNEALMRGQRAALGLLPIDQTSCSSAQESADEDPSERKDDGLCSVNLSRYAEVACQTDNPAAFCFCGSPDDRSGFCSRSYDPFESPEEALARGVPNPYDCYVKGPEDVRHPRDYKDYDAATFYGYRFVGEECMVDLRANRCDLNDKEACEELGDLRYQFITHVQHGGVAFGGVAQPLSDPTTGELIVSTAAAAAESIEKVGTLASQFFPVLRGEVSEEEYFSGESVRGYYARLGKVEHPVSIAPSGTDGYSVSDPSRPASRVDGIKELQKRMEQTSPRIQRLFGSEGRAAILSDRLHELEGSEIASRIDAVVNADAASQVSASDRAPKSILSDSPLDQVLRERARKQAMAARNMDDFDAKLYNSQYWEYWAKAFAGVSTAEASLRMQQKYYGSVMTHEIGHALGLRHNFAGSLDRDNYHDGYFPLARKVPLPAYLDYDRTIHGGDADGTVTGDEAQRWAVDLRKARESRLALGAGNVMTSSVMDYEGDLSGFGGMGRYDAAAVMFAYFDKVETYDTADPTRYPEEPAAGIAKPFALEGLQAADSHRRDLFTYYRGGESCKAEADCPHSRGYESTAYQPVTQRCLPNARVPSRGGCADGGCVCSNFDDDFKTYAARASRDFTPVTYLYCHDNRANDLSWCTKGDAGESFQEVVDHYRLSWLQRYPQMYFRNYRGSDPARGFSYSSVPDAVKIYQHLFFRSNYEGDEYTTDPGPLGQNDQLFASADVLNWLAEIISAPDVGSYAFDPAQNVYRQISTEPGQLGADLSLEPGQGFYLWSAYQAGQSGFARLERAGLFLDKLLAIESLARRDWGFSYTIDERYYINFYDFFDREVVDLFSGLILRNPAAYAPRVAASSTGGPKLSYVNHFRFFDARGNNEQTYPLPAVDGTDSEVLRDSAAIQALAEFPIFYDTSFEQRLLIFKTGSAEGYTIPKTRADGTPTCGYGDVACVNPDYIVYDSDRLHTSYVAVVIQPERAQGIDEQQLGYLLLLKLTQTAERIFELEAIASPTEEEQGELTQRRLDLERDETFVEYLIELARSFGISSYF